MTKPKDTTLRPWPRGLRRPDAAAYVGISVTKFDDWVQRGIMPAPKRIDAVVLWDRLDIDRSFDALSDTTDDPYSDFGNDAENPWLVAAERIAGKRPTTSFTRQETSRRSTSECDPLAEWHRKIGFDPESMTEADRLRLMREAHARWKASIPSTALNKREHKALLQLRPHTAGKKIDYGQVKIGPDTADRLEARDFIEILQQGDRCTGFILTGQGYTEIQRLFAQDACASEGSEPL